MKTTRLFGVTVAILGGGLLLLSSCSKNPSEVDSNPSAKRQLHVSVDDVTRASLDGLDVKWDDRDKIKVFYQTASGETAASDFVLVNGAGSTSATFEEAESHMSDGDKILYALYPAEGYWDYAAAGEHEVPCSIPAEQSIGKLAMPMYGTPVSDEGKITFRNSAAVFALRLQGSGTITRIRLASTSHCLAGPGVIDAGAPDEPEFRVEYDNGSWGVYDEANASKEISFDCGSLSLSDEPVEIHFVVPILPGTAGFPESSLAFELYNGDNLLVSKENTTEKRPERNRKSVFPVWAFSGSDLFVDRSLIELKADGGTQKFTVDALSPYTVEYSHVPWLTVSGAESGATLPASSETVVSITAEANFFAPREAVLTVTPQQGNPVKITVRQSNEVFLEGNRDFPCIWEFAESQAAGHKATFIDKNYLKTSNGSAASISFVRLDENDRINPYGRTIGTTGHPLIYTGLHGDYWLFTVPVTDLPARSAVDFICLFASVPAAGRYHSLEYFDEGVWKSAYETLPVPGASTYTYTHMTPGTTSSSRKIASTIVFEQAFHNENIYIRLRQSSNINASGSEVDPMVKSNNGIYDASDIGVYIRLLDGPVPAESEKILFVGNSYTFYNLSPGIFKEIAWSEGHHASIEMVTNSAYTMAQHMKLAASMAVVNLGGYDYAVLQDQSLQLAIYGTDKDTGILEDMQKMIDAIKEKSPTVTPVIEMTWGRRDGYDNANYDYDFMKTYEAMQDKIIQSGIEEAKAADAWSAPVGVAWKQVRSERPDIELYVSDGSHPSYAGSYLVACVLYLTIYGEPFGNNTADCLLDAPTAAYLRGVAQDVVIGNEEIYNIRR